MCLIMTIIAALISGLILLSNAKKGTASKSLVTLTLMYTGAALMWLVDSIASVIGGEGFFDISWADTLLGAIIIAAGSIVYFAMVMIERRKLAKASA